MRVYLDNCCFNRPFDEQTQIRIALETQAVLFIQTQIVQNMIELIWSYVLTYESGRNPYSSKKESIRNFARKYAISVVLENDRIIEDANRYQKDNVNKLDALHLACAKDAAAPVAVIGIVLTPQHLTEFMVELSGANKNSKVVDICCGSEAFLVTAMSKMLRESECVNLGVLCRII